jgi:hypothetical protein
MLEGLRTVAALQCYKGRYELVVTQRERCGAHHRLPHLAQKRLGTCQVARAHACIRPVREKHVVERVHATLSGDCQPRGDVFEHGLRLARWPMIYCPEITPVRARERCDRRQARQWL